MSDPAWIEKLAGTLRAKGVEESQHCAEMCAVHFARMLRWNQTHNLTRITDPGEALAKHYLDCLLALRLVSPPAAFVDVGSGAGFPGLLAAVLWPQADACLVEPSEKRASFLRLVGAEMRVNVRVVGPGAHQAPMVLSRATFSPGKRRALVPYAAARARILVWGAPHDLDTWREEVGTWRSWQAGAMHYEVSGLPSRALLYAER